MQILIFLLLGLILGSFTNVFVDRSHAKKDFLHGRSVCDHCGRQLTVVDLVPVISWLLLLGRCRRCRKRISIQYPLVELAGGAVFAASYHFWPRELTGGYEQVYFGLWLISVVLLVALALYDLKWMILPDRFNYPLLLLGLLAASVLVQMEGIETLKQSAQGFVLAWSFFAGLYYVSRGRWLGGGDVKLAAAIGLWLGFPNVLAGILLGFYAATAIVLPLLIVGVLKRRQPVPFGPFLILGFIVTQLAGDRLVDWYLGLFSLV